MARVMVAAWLALWPVEAGAAQTEDGEPSLLVLLDASESMAGQRLDTVKEVFGDLLGGLPPGVPFGVRTFGGATKAGDGCAGTDLVVPIGFDPTAALAAVGEVEAAGSDAVAAALQEAAGDLPLEGERTIMLVSDGFDDCSPSSACEAASGLVAGGADLRIESIGVDAGQSDADELRCMAETTGGIYRDATDGEALASALQEVWDRAFRSFGVLGLSIHGGATPEAAPALDADQYVDRIRPNETLFYRVDLDEEGQQVAASAILVGRVEGRDTASTVFRVGLVAPDGSENDTGEADGVGETARTVSVGSGPLDPDGVGSWYLSLELVDEGGRLAPDGYDVELLIDIPGAPVAPASIPTTAPPGGNGTSTSDGDSGAAAPAAGGEGGNDIPTVTAFAILAMAAAGVVIGLVAHARRRPS